MIFLYWHSQVIFIKKKPKKGINPTDSEDDFLPEIETGGYEEYSSNALQHSTALYTPNDAILLNSDVKLGILLNLKSFY